MSTAQIVLLAMIPAAYLLGSAPFGYLVGLSQGIDVRKAGSGNIGATNVGRLLGGKFFALVFILDLLKGLAPMIGAGIAVRASAADWAASGAWVPFAIWLAVGFSAILGHMFSIFLGFKGGKGVATSAGVVLGLSPYFTLPGLIALTVWSILFARTRIVSLASIAAAILFPIAYLAIALAWNWNPFGDQLPLLIFSLLMCFLIVFRHRANIARLRAGTEHRFVRTSSRISGNGDSDGNGVGEGNGNGDGEDHSKRLR